MQTYLLIDIIASIMKNHLANFSFLVYRFVIVWGKKMELFFLGEIIVPISINIGMIIWIIWII
jgi:hypothetical protein